MRPLCECCLDAQDATNEVPESVCRVMVYDQCAYLCQDCMDALIRVGVKEGFKINIHQEGQIGTNTQTNRLQ